MAGPGAFLTVPALRQDGIRVAFTGRHGGTSTAPFGSLNLSFVSGDDAEVVQANRSRALTAIGGELSQWCGGRQVHGAQVAVGTQGPGAYSADSTIPDTDAIWTDQDSIALAVLTADCVPVLLADSQARRIAVVHAGWRGLVAGVIEAAADAMGGAGVGVIGPAIGPCCYEVGSEVADAATDALGAVLMRGTHLDLWRGTRAALSRAGVERVHLAALCTRCEPHRFYSHRAGDTGRQGLIARLDPR
jgi:polyphenol oxidase